MRSASELMSRAQAARGPAGRNAVQLELLESEDLDEGMAGLAELRALPQVDPRRIAVLDHSFGGSLALFLLARDTALRAAVVFGAAARSWALSSELRARLRAAVRHTAPIFLIHAANDYSTAPGTTLATELHQLGRPYRLRIYPAFGRTSREGHNFVYRGVAQWQADVFKFLESCMGLP